MPFLGAEMARRAILLRGCSFHPFRGSDTAQAGEEIGFKSEDMEIDDMLHISSP